MHQNRGRERGGNSDGYRNGYSGGGSSGNRGGFGGRGGFRGGRGGGRGGGHGQDIRVFSPAGGRTVPKAAIKNLEDKIVKLEVPKNGADFSVQRPAYGTNGTKITLYTNFVEMDIDKNLELHRYAIFIKPEARDKRKEQIIRLLVQQLNKKGVVSDYAANLITTSKLDGGECQTIPVQYCNKTESVATEKAPVYQVKLEYRKIMALSELLQDLKNPHVNKQYQVNKDEVIQALNIVLKDHAKVSNDRFTIGKNQGGNRIYSKDDNATQADIGEGAIALRGFFTSVRPATDRLLLNINVSNGAFYKAKRLDELFTSDFRRFAGWFDSGFRALDKNFAKLKVMTTHLPERKNGAGEVIRRYKTIIGFADPKDGAKETHPPRVKEFAAGPNDVSFWFEENSEFAKGRKPAAPGYRTVTDHFRIAYGIKVSNYYPVLNVGTKEKPSYIPAEVCQVVKGQAWRKLLSAFQTDKMLKFSG
ncbi:N-alpha-acetyltransferase 35 NatC auxiliary subunit, partial [Ascosphaera pollenicola]